MKSLMALSMHKAGSSITDQILVEICRARGYEIEQITKTVAALPLSEADAFVAHQDRIRDQGVYYGIARGPYVDRLHVLSRLRIIVQLRDPRDCITSAYFSYRDSHLPPEDPAKLVAFENRRAEINASTIDSYAVSQAQSYRRRMRNLLTILSTHPDALVLRYEEMVERTEDWLGRISTFLDQPITEDLRATLGGKISFRVPEENTARHKRQVTPGDHKRKLTPATIDRLNQEMADEMAEAGYGP